MFQSLDLFVLVFLSVAVESLTGNVSPPQNVSVLWTDDFSQKLSWAPPRDLTNCTPKYVASAQNRPDVPFYQNTRIENYTSFNVVMEGGFLQFSVKTVCGKDRESELVFLNFTYPELVRNVQCYIRSSSKADCSWQPASHDQDFRFFYMLIDGNKPQLQECSSYSFTDGRKTSCNLQMKDTKDIMMVFNGTVNNTLVRNTFRHELIQVRPPPLNWTVIKDGDKFNISWIPPDVLQGNWKFKINYTECGKERTLEEGSKNSIQLNRLAHCPYRMTIKAEPRHRESAQGTEWSDIKSFDADTNSKAVVYAVVILIPLMFAGLAVLTFVCCRRNKENIFPKVPEPRDLLSDISDNNNKITVRNLYVPAKEEEDCKITLVIDPQLSKSHP